MLFTEAGSSALGACLATDDVLSPDWSNALAEGNGDVHSTRDVLLKQTAKWQHMIMNARPVAGFLCNAWVADAHIWSSVRASKFELQEMWAKLFNGRRLFLVLGDGAAAPEKMLSVF